MRRLHAFAGLTGFTLVIFMAVTGFVLSLSANSMASRSRLRSCAYASRRLLAARVCSAGSAAAPAPLRSR